MWKNKISASFLSLLLWSCSDLGGNDGKKHNKLGQLAI